MIPFPLHLEMLQPKPRPLTSIERELAAIESRAVRPPSRRRRRRFPLVRRTPVTVVSNDITIRTATAADRPALERLAHLDQRQLPSGAALVAEVEGRIVAGVSLTRSEPVVSDPFRARREVVHLLEVCAEQLAA